MSCHGEAYLSLIPFRDSPYASVVLTQNRSFDEFGFRFASFTIERQELVVDVACVSLIMGGCESIFLAFEQRFELSRHLAKT